MVTQLTAKEKEQILLKNHKHIADHLPVVQTHYKYCTGCGKYLGFRKAGIVQVIKNLFSGRLYIHGS